LPFLARRARAQSLALATEFWEIAQARQDNVGGDANKQGDDRGRNQAPVIIGSTIFQLK